MALGVEGAAPLVPALGNDEPLPDDDSAHHGVGGRPAPAGQLQRPAHVVVFVHGLPPNEKRCLEQIVQDTMKRQGYTTPTDKTKAPE